MALSGGGGVGDRSSKSSADTMIDQSNNWRTVSPELQFAPPSPALTGRSERILRWKSRESFPDVNLLLDAHDHENGNAAAALSRSSSLAWNSQQALGQGGARPMSPSRFSKLVAAGGIPYSRHESFTRRGESVRRTASMDFDALQSSKESSTYSRFESGSTSTTYTVPSFDELLNQVHPGSSAGQNCESPRVRNEAGNGEESPSTNRNSFMRQNSSIISTSRAGPGEELKSKNLTNGISIKPDERSQILKARKLLEFRSNVKLGLPLAPGLEAGRSRLGRGDSFQDRNSSPYGDHDENRLQQQQQQQQERKFEITTGDMPRSSCEYTDLSDMAQQLALVSEAKPLAQSFRDSNGSPKVMFNSVAAPSPENGYENGHGHGDFSPRTDIRRAPILQAAGESNSMRSSTRVVEFSGLLLPPKSEGLGSSQMREKGNKSPQTRARNSFVERLEGGKSSSAEAAGVAVAQLDRSDAVTLLIPIHPSRNGTNAGGSVKRGEALSQSARFAGSSQSVRKALESSTRTSGLSLSVSCRRLSIEDVPVTSRSNQQVSFGCRPSPLRPRAAAAVATTTTSSEEKLSSRNVQVEKRSSPYHDQKVSDSRLAVGSSQSKPGALIVSKPKKTTPATASAPAEIFKKWVASQFHFGGSKKNKDHVYGIVKSSASTTPTPPFQDPDKHLLYQLPAANGGPDKASSRRVLKNPGAEHQVGSGPTIVPTAAAELPAHPLPKPPGDSTSDGRKENLALVHQSVDNNANEGQHRHEKTSSRRVGQPPSVVQSSSMNRPSGPQKFQGLQNLFTAEFSSSPKQQLSQGYDSPTPDSDSGKPKRTMKFLECAEIAHLNEFLRAKRDSFTSCQENGSGYLKFIATTHPTEFVSDIGSMISAICYSYYLEKRPNGPGRWSVVPLLSFPRWKMKDHLDAAWLFNVCGLDVKALLFIDEVDFEGLSKAGVTTRTMLVGEQVLGKPAEVGSCCTLLAEGFLRDADELWTRSGSFLKTLLIAGLLMDTDNLSKPTSSAVNSRDHQGLLSLATGAGPLGRFGLYERMRTVNSDLEVLKMAKRYYGTAPEEQKPEQQKKQQQQQQQQKQHKEASPRPLPPPPPPPPSEMEAKKSDGAAAKLLSPKGSPLFSSETEDNSRSSSSSSERSPRSNTTASIPTPKKAQLGGRSLSPLGRLPNAADARNSPIRMPSPRKSGLAY